MYSLREPLPSDVFAHASGPFGGFRRFPVFSVPWLKGRCALFIPITIGIGAMQATLIGLELQDTRLGWETAAVSIPIWMVIGSAGPILATFARHRLPLPRVTVTLAILLGVVLSFYGQHLAEVYSRTTVLPRYMAVFPGFNGASWLQRSTVFNWTIRCFQFLIFSLLGGGIALFAFCIASGAGGCSPSTRVSWRP